MASSTVFLSACAVLAYTGFCRLTRTDVSTQLVIRLSFWALTVGALCAATAVLVWAYQPGWPSALLAACMAVVQVATSRMWRAGVPPAYQQYVKGHKWQ